MELIFLQFKKFKDDSLYINSIYLIASTLVLSVFGFLFWIIAARFFKTEQVGFATTVISITTFISGLSLLGFNVGIVRYYSKIKEKNGLISSSFILVTLVSLFLSVIFLLFIDFISPQLSFLKKQFYFFFIFIFFTIFLSLSNILEGVFVALKESKNILIKNTILSLLKIIFLFMFISLGTLGIFSSFSFATILSFLLGAFILKKYHKFNLKLSINRKIVKKVFAFSIGNYISSFLQQAPTLLLPLFIINSLSSKEAAYFYIDTMIFNLLIVIPSSISQSLFAEGSENRKTLQMHYSKSFKIVFFLLIPAVLSVVLFGNIVLHFFGKNYEENAVQFLKVISISSVLTPFYFFGSSILRIKHNIRHLILINMIGCIVTLLLSYSLISFGLFGVGIGFVSGQIFTSLILISYQYKYILNLFKNIKIPSSVKRQII